MISGQMNSPGPVGWAALPARSSVCETAQRIPSKAGKRDAHSPRRCRGLPKQETGLETGQSFFGHPDPDAVADWRSTSLLIIQKQAAMLGGVCEPEPICARKLKQTKE